MNQSEALQWSSHFPAIMACLGETKEELGGIIEVGIGFFSTIQLHAYCMASGNYLESWEDNREWFDRFKYLENSNHKFVIGPYDFSDKGDRWNMAFIDHSPGGKSRADAFSLFIETSLFVVVHDYWKENEEAIAPLLVGCKYHVCRRQEPPTLIASNKLSLPLGVFDL